MRMIALGIGIILLRIIGVIATLIVTTSIVYSFIEKKGFKGALLVTYIAIIINLIINKSFEISGFIIGLFVAAFESLIYLAIFKKSKNKKSFIIKCIVIYLIIAVVIIGVMVVSALTMSNSIINMADEVAEKQKEAVRREEEYLLNYEKEYEEAIENNNYDFDTEEQVDNNYNMDTEEQLDNNSNLEEEVVIDINETDISSIVLPEGYENAEIIDLTYDTIVAVKKDNKFAFYDIEKNEFLTEFIYDGLGYDTQITDVSGEESVLVIPKETGIEGIVVNVSGLYGIYEKNTRTELIPCACSRIYSINSGDERTYYMEFNGIQLEAREYFESHNMITVE